MVFINYNILLRLSLTLIIDYTDSYSPSQGELSDSQALLMPKTTKRRENLLEIPNALLCFTAFKGNNPLIVLLSSSFGLPQNYCRLFLFLLLA